MKLIKLMIMTVFSVICATLLFPGTANATEEIDEATGLKKPEIILEEFRESVSFMETDPNFDKYLSKYEQDYHEEYYLDADPMNTREQWDSMSRTERFVYYMSYTLPYGKLVYRDPVRDEEEFLEHFDTHEKTLGAIEKGDEVYAALQKVWSYQYMYWQATGMVCNFFNPAAQATTQEDSNKPSESNQDDMAQIKAELGEELVSEIEEIVEQEIKAETATAQTAANEPGTSPVIWVVVIIAAVAIAAGSFFLGTKKK